jgi:hypothetical protein
LKEFMTFKQHEPKLEIIIGLELNIPITQVQYIFEPGLVFKRHNDIVISSAEAIGAFNTGVAAVNLHRPTAGSNAAGAMKLVSASCASSGAGLMTAEAAAAAAAAAKGSRVA